MFLHVGFFHRPPIRPLHKRTQQPLGIRLREAKGAQENFIVIGKNVTRFQELPSLLDRLNWVVREHTLIGRLLNRERGLVAKHDIQES